MTRTPTTVLPQTLTFLVEESRVCEAEALVRLLAQGNGHAVWNRGLAEEWRAHLAASGVNLGDYPLFPLLYVRNNQLPRAARSFRDYATAADAPAEDRFRTFLEMLRLLWNKRQVPLEKYKGKLKRDRTNLITTERALLGRDRLFDEGWALLEGVGHPQGLYAIALSPEWVVYPVVRQFLDSARDRLELQGTLPPWWVQADIKTAVYGEDLAQLETLAPQIAGAGFNPDETRSLERRYFRQIARLKELAVREAERAQREAAYLASIR
ncbi:MAG TPA: hypothetical protein VEI97_14995, partial [bacterium]|nr:hypothetical protein [bacterium]